MDNTPRCEAKFRGTTWTCERCSLSWDNDDPSPPECLTNEEIGKRTIERLKKEVKSNDKT